MIFGEFYDERRDALLLLQRIFRVEVCGEGTKACATGFQLFILQPPALNGPDCLLAIDF